MTSLVCDTFSPLSCGVLDTRPLVGDATMPPRPPPSLPAHGLELDLGQRVPLEPHPRPEAGVSRLDHGWKTFYIFDPALYKQ